MLIPRHSTPRIHLRGRGNAAHTRTLADDATARREPPPPAQGAQPAAFGSAGGRAGPASRPSPRGCSGIGRACCVMLVAIGALYAFAPRLPPELVMRMYRARPLDPRHGEQIAYIVDELSRRAELPAAPAVYVIPSMTLNAFATGTPDKAVIGITEGLLRRLSLQRARRRAGPRDQPHPQQRPGRDGARRRDDPLHANALLPGAVPGDLQPAGAAARRFRHLAHWRCCCSISRPPSAACCSWGSRARASTTPTSRVRS